MGEYDNNNLYNNIIQIYKHPPIANRTSQLLLLLFSFIFLVLSHKIIFENSKTLFKEKKIWLVTLPYLLMVLYIIMVNSISSNISLLATVATPTIIFLISNLIINIAFFIFDVIRNLKNNTR